MVHISSTALNLISWDTKEETSEKRKIPVHVCVCITVKFPAICALQRLNIQYYKRHHMVLSK